MGRSPRGGDAPGCPCVPSGAAADPPDARRRAEARLQLAAPFDISLQAVSRHIQVLVRAGLVAQERTGRISRAQPRRRPDLRGRGVGQPLQQVLAAAVRHAGRRPRRDRDARSRSQTRAEAVAPETDVSPVTPGFAGKFERSDMEDHRIVSQQEWLAARKQHLVREKEFTRMRQTRSPPNDVPLAGVRRQALRVRRPGRKAEPRRSLRRRAENS